MTGFCIRVRHLGSGVGHCHLPSGFHHRGVALGHNGDHKGGARLRRVIAVVTIAVVTMGPGYVQLDLCRRQRLCHNDNRETSIQQV